MSAPLLRFRAAHYHTVPPERRCASQQKLRADVADGSSAAVNGGRGDGRSAPQSRPRWAGGIGLLGAINRHPPGRQTSPQRTPLPRQDGERPRHGPPLSSWPKQRKAYTGSPDAVSADEVIE